MERWKLGPTDAYLALRDEITARAAELFERYASHLKCRRGCSFCCDNIHVPAIERAAVSEWLDTEAGSGVREAARRRRASQASHALTAGEKQPSGERAAAPNRCAFLGSEGECTVYPVRPLICRTYGLPLAYRVYEYDMHGRELHPESPEYTELWCDLNFSSLEQDEAKRLFDRDGTINQAAVDERLDVLNEEFLALERERSQSDSLEGASAPLEKLL